MSVVKVVLVAWGVVMTLSTAFLWTEVGRLQQVAQEELKLIDAHDRIYTDVLVKEAEAIDQLNAEMDLLTKLNGIMQQNERLQNTTKKPATNL